MDFTRRFLDLCKELEKAISMDQWDLAEDLLEERHRLIEKQQPGVLTQAGEEEINQADERVRALIQEKRKELLGSVRRRQDIARYGRS